MALENSITVIGNLTRDPELRYTTQGTAVVNFSVAHTPRRKTDSGWEDGDTSFFNCSAWRDLGEHIAASFQKGQRVIVIGTMQQRSWEDNDGNKRTSYDVQVDEAGHSLKWGEAHFDKAERTGNKSSNTPPPNEPIYTDEEPF